MGAQGAAPHPLGTGAINRRRQGREFGPGIYLCPGKWPQAETFSAVDSAKGPFRAKGEETMARRDPVNWMLSEAIDSLARAERLRRQFFILQSTAGSREPSWEPPIDVLETESEFLILVALPGVDLDRVEAVIEDGTLVVSGRRELPVELGKARIHRLELPQGRFERRIALPLGRYAVSRFAVNGCVALRLAKSV
jgi:HSP20 family protein